MTAKNNDTPSLEEALEVIGDLIAKIEFLLDGGYRWSADGTFTFPDGETVRQRHRAHWPKSSFGETWCGLCGLPWPCPDVLFTE